MSTELKPFDSHKAEIELFVAPLKSIAVTDSKSLAFAQAAGTNIKSFMKKVEATRDAAVRPHNEHVKKINAYSKEIVKPLEEIEKLIKSQLLSYHNAMQIEKEKELKRIETEKQAAIAKAREELKQKQEEQAALSMFDAAPDTKRQELVVAAEAERLEREILTNESSQVEALAEMKVAGSRKVWAFLVIDEALIPREYMSVNEVALRRAVLDGAREIPGIRIFQETKISLGGR